MTRTTTASTLPRALIRITQFGIGFVALAALFVLAALFLSDEGIEVPVTYTLDDGSYSLVGESWGTGDLGVSHGVVRFDESDAVPAMGAVTAVFVYAVPGLVMLVLLLQVFRTMAAGRPFTPENARRIRWIGALVIIVGLLSQALRWIVEWLVTRDVTATGLHLELRIEPDLSVVFLGLVIVALGAVFDHGTRLQADSDLTV